MQGVALLLLLASVRPGTTSTCSITRRESDQTVSLPCTRQRLREATFRLPASVRTQDVSRIQLNDNSISVIGDHAFSNFTRLDVLELQNNDIRSVAANAFLGTRLTKLDLSNNRLTVLPIDALRDLPFLVELDLALNRIASVPQTAFTFNTNLEKIDLESNVLRYVDPRALDPLVGLQRRYAPLIVNLANNSLSSLDPALEHAPAFGVISFKLNDNPWHCNCSLSFLFFKLKMRYDDVVSEDWPICHSPQALGGKSWERLTRMDFACAPHISNLSSWTASWTMAGGNGNKSVVEAWQGETLHIVCRGYVDPPQDVAWTRDGDSLPFRDGRSQRVPSLTNVVHFSEHLTLDNLRVNDSGTYSCSVANVAGSSHHNVTIVVRERPVESNDAAAREANWNPGQSASSTARTGAMQYVLLASACVGGAVLVLAVAAFAYYCVKHRYLSYRAVVYRVRKQEQAAEARKAEEGSQRGTGHNHSNYLNFNAALGAECSAGLLLARPVALADDVPVYPPTTSFTKLDSPLAAGRASPSFLQRPLHYSDASLRRLPVAPGSASPNNNNHESMRCAQADCDSLLECQRNDTLCSCTAPPCRVYFAPPYCTDSVVPCANSTSPVTVPGNNCGHYARITTCMQPQSSPICRYTPRLSNDLLNATLIRSAALENPQKTVNYNNLACTELDDKSPTLSNSTNSTAMFAKLDVERL